MGKSYHLLFFLRKSRSKLEGKAGIYFRITVEGKRSEMSLSRSVNPNKWNTNKERVLGADRETVEINTIYIIPTTIKLRMAIVRFL